MNAISAQNLGADIDSGALSSVFWESVLQRSPNDPAALNNLGNAYHTEGRLANAISAYESAIQIAPNQSEIYYNLAMVLSHLGETEKAEHACRYALTIDPCNGLYYTMLGSICAAQGKMTDAIRLYENAIEFGDAIAAYNMSVIYEGTDQIAAAEEAYLRYLSLVGRFDALETCDE